MNGIAQPRADVAVIGGGVIGLAIAWRCAQAGLSVTVCDEQPGHGASWAAAGMLAPVTEAHYGEEPLLALNLASACRWPSFAAELQEETGIDVGLRTNGTLAVAYDDDDLAALDELGRFQTELGLPVARLRGRECRSREPLLHPRIRGGLLVGGDHQVDNRRLMTALLAAVHEHRVDLVAENVADVEVSGGHTTGVRLAGGARVAARAVVVAAGCWSGALGLPEAVTPPVRPVKGQILRLQADAKTPVPQHSVRGLARGRSVYVVPRAEGEVVVGATVEELGFDTRVTADAVHELLAAAIDVVPVIAELEFVEALARLRPGTPDNAPILGPTAVEGLVMATGHYRNGILLAPVTSDAIAGLVTDGAWNPVADPFTLARFG